MKLTFIHTLLLIMAALIGNAQIGGYDLSLYILMPPLAILTIFYMRRINGMSLFKTTLMVFALGFLWLTAVQLDVPYSEYYHLWPIKAIILGICIAFGPRPDWNIPNQFIYFGFCLLLVIAGGVNSGRFESFFGPNMLYRMFGLLYIFSFVFLLLRKEKILSHHLALVIFGAFMTLLTGSVAAVLIIFLPILLIIPQLKTGGRLALFVASGLGFVLFTTFYNSLLKIQIVSRALWKYETFESSARFEGWSDVLSQGFSWGGHSYDSFGDVWKFGYSYPHNIFIELYAFYGAVGLAVAVVMITTLIRYHNKASITYLAFVTITLGAMLSGDLSDNFGAIALGLGLASHAGERRKVKNYSHNRAPRNHQPINLMQ